MVLRIVVISMLIAVSSGRNAMPDKTDVNFQNDCLKAHNDYRAAHNTPPLTIDPKLVAYAKTRCNTVSQQEMLNAGHAGLQSGYGENLAWSASTANSIGTGNSSVKMWYDEIKDYNYANPGFSSKTGHFTQVVWKSSTRVGCARSFGKGDKWYETYVCCNYQTPGNYQGQFPQNVLPKK